MLADIQPTGPIKLIPHTLAHFHARHFGRFCHLRSKLLAFGRGSRVHEYTPASCPSPLVAVSCCIAMDRYKAGLPAGGDITLIGSEDPLPQWHVRIFRYEAEERWQRRNGCFSCLQIPLFLLLLSLYLLFFQISKYYQYTEQNNSPRTSICLSGRRR